MVDINKHLRDRMTRIGAQSAPSLHPPPSGTPKQTRSGKPPEPPPPTLEALEEEGVFTRSEVKQIWQLTRAIADANAEIAELTAAKKPLVEHLKAIFDCRPKMRVAVGDLTLSYYSSTHPRLNKDLLLAQGVRPGIIAAATVTSTSWQVRISAPGGSDGDQE